MNTVCDPQLLLDLPLHELDGAAFPSRDAYGHVCSVNGSHWTPRGRVFDGVDDYLVPDFLPGALGALTVEAWVRFAVTQIDMAVFHLVSSGEGRAVSLRSNGCEVQPDGVGIGPGWHSWTCGALAAGRFWHLAMTWDGAVLRAYLDGRQDGAPVSIAGVLDAAGQSLAVGRNPEGAWFMDGTIGAVRCYCRALAPPEIARHYVTEKWRYR